MVLINDEPDDNICCECGPRLRCILGNNEYMKVSNTFLMLHVDF